MKTYEYKLKVEAKTEVEEKRIAAALLERARRVKEGYYDEN